MPDDFIHQGESALLFCQVKPLSILIDHRISLTTDELASKAQSILAI
jgi:hypothetical protein